jgi:hypothetical protein
MWPIFQGKTCMARTDVVVTSQCTLGGFPEYAVNVSTAAQVQLAVNFARNLDIRLVIKNTGHEYFTHSFVCLSYANTLQLPWKINRCRLFKLVGS